MLLASLLSTLACSVGNIGQGKAPEVAFFDMVPYCDTSVAGGVAFKGAWSNYPYFASKTIVVSGIETGLWLLKGTF
jgi:hypothetical protein